MKRLVKIIPIIIALFAFHGFTSSDSANSNYNYKEYKLGPNSILEVNGKTNINSFCCTSQQRFPEGKLSYQFEAQAAIINFQDASLSVTIDELDCGAKAINKDLQKALQADQYPNITIDLKQVFNLECSDLTDCDRWLDFEAIADITIVCTSKSISIPLQIKKNDDHHFRIVGGTIIQMCDFGIEAPTALMGLIKVKDTLKINFDLDLYLL